MMILCVHIWKVSSEDLWRKPLSSLEEDILNTQRVGQRRWNCGKGRQRQRPVSDYGQFASRKFFIPKNDLPVQPPNMDFTDSEDTTDASCVDSQPQQYTIIQHHENQKRRPISVIGGFNVYENNSEQMEDLLTVQVRWHFCYLFYTEWNFSILLNKGSSEKPGNLGRWASHRW